MIYGLIDLLCRSMLGRAAAVGIVIALAVAGLQVRGCMKAREELRQYEQAEKIRRHDRTIEKESEERQNEVENYSTPDDFSRGFDRLRQYGE